MRPMAKRTERHTKRETYLNSGVMTYEALGRLLNAEGWEECPEESIPKIRNYIVDIIRCKATLPGILIAIPIQENEVLVIRGAEFDQYFDNTRKLLEAIKNNESRFYAKPDNSRT